MVNLQVKAENAMKRFRSLSKQVKDMSNVFNEFIQTYTQVFVKSAFNTRGKIMGSRWPAYKKTYLEWKQQNYPGQPMLVLKGDLYNAATGLGNKFYKKVKKKECAFGIKRSLRYARVHQEGGGNNIPQRAYFYQTNKQMPFRAINTLIETTVKAIEKAGKKK